MNLSSIGSDFSIFPKPEFGFIIKGLIKNYEYKGDFILKLLIPKGPSPISYFSLKFPSGFSLSLSTLILIIFGNDSFPKIFDVIKCNPINDTDRDCI